MNKGLFAGWRDVFSFTFARQTENKYRKSTVIMAIIFFVLAAAISIIIAFVQKKEDEVIEIEKVYVYNDSGLSTIYFDGFLEANKEQFPKISFETSDQGIEALAASLAEKDSKDVILHLENTETGYAMTVILPAGGGIEKAEAEKLSEELGMMMEQSKLLSSEIPMEKLVFAMSGVSSNLHIAGEDDKSEGEKAVQMLVPMLIIFVTFFFCLIYGTTVGQAVSIEKTSKLMEMILVHIRPYPLIIGKVVAITLSAVLQFFIWIASFIAGFLCGHMIAKDVIYDGYHNVLIEVIEALKAADGSAAFTIPSLIVGIVCLLCGFFFFCMVAAVVACFATKPEELGQVMSFFTLSLMASFYATYMLPMMTESEMVSRIMRIIPFSSALLTPGDILVGNCGLMEGILETALLLVFAVVLAIIAGKTYQSLVLNKGKNIFAVLFAKKAKKEA